MASPMIDVPADVTTRLVVGMEIHVELATRSKMFTSAPNVAHRDNFAAEPNTLLDPVVLGMPGVLPVINRDAVAMSIKVGLALGCKIASFTKWDRKSYFYPDLPKNYQISQYDLPLCYDGAVDIDVSDHSGNLPDSDTKRIGIIRAHLEEDAGKLLHEAPGGGAIDHSIVDLNRSGTPLLEIVTAPDFNSADEAVTFAQMLRKMCLFLGVTEGIMQQGHIRFEPNINVEIERGGKLYKTPIVEIKNLNSFKAVWGAINYEYQRQVDEWLDTGKVMGRGAKSTRGWDDGRQETFLQREKEDAHDYRYFPDPDLVPLRVSDEWIEDLRSHMAELPHDRQKRYTNDVGLDEKTAAMLLEEPGTSDLFDKLLTLGVDGRRAASVLMNYGAKHANERGTAIHRLPITAQHIKDIVDLAKADKISSSGASDLFGLCCDEPASTAAALAEKHSLLQVSDTGALEAFVDQVLADPSSAKAVADIKAGKGKAAGSLVGQVMKLSKGQANPKVVGDLIQKKVAEL